MAYNTRIIGKLTNLANMLAANNYRNEATAIRTIIGRISNWKEGQEWNPTNALMMPDADNVLEDLIVKFNLAIGEAKRREEMAKKVESKPLEPTEKGAENVVEEVDTTALEKAVNELASLM